MVDSAHLDPRRGVCDCPPGDSSDTSVRPYSGRLVIFINGEFDPGSGRTLAACLTHASRTVNRFRAGISGERVSNTWVTCPPLWDNSGKPGLIPDMTRGGIASGGKFFGGGWT